MKRALVVWGILILAALDWAALHDILKQNEPSYYSEYTILVASVLIFAGLGIRALLGRRA